MAIRPDDSMLSIWRTQPENRFFTDAQITRAIWDAYTEIDRTAKRAMTDGARDIAAAYLVRSRLNRWEEPLLRDIVALLTGSDE